jgi:small conductance mechanosensitive channel
MNLDSFISELGQASRLGLILGIAVAVHFVVNRMRHLGDRMARARTRPWLRKLGSVASLTNSALIFAVYFLAVGLLLREFNVSLTAYLASASIIGLAVGFGSQGLVQDVVTGLTLVFSDLFDVGEMVEISGQAGIVQKIGMRFVELQNPFGARVFIPNRTITNVINYPKGYVRYIADIRLSTDADRAERMREIVVKLVPTVEEQFPGILRTSPSLEGEMQTSAGVPFMRIKFRVWPNRGEPIEKTFKQALLAELRKIDPDYADWMMAVYYEVEKQTRRR